MAKEIVLFESKERQSRTEIGELLRQLAEKIESGKITLAKGEGQVSLDLPQNVTVEVKVEEEQKRVKGKQYSLEVELEWYDNPNQNGPLTIK